MSEDKSTPALKLIGERVRETVERLGGPTKTAEKVGVNRNTVYNWIQTGQIKSGDLLALQSIGADMAYILTGVRLGSGVRDESGEYAINTGWPDPDLDLLHQIVLVLETELQSTDRELDPQDKADFIKLTYRMFCRRLAQFPERDAEADPLDRAEIIDLMDVANFRRR